MTTNGLRGKPSPGRGVHDSSDLKKVLSVYAVARPKSGTRTLPTPSRTGLVCND